MHDTCGEWEIPVVLVDLVILCILVGKKIDYLHEFICYEPTFTVIIFHQKTSVIWFLNWNIVLSNFHFSRGNMGGTQKKWKCNIVECLVAMWDIIATAVCFSSRKLWATQTVWRPIWLVPRWQEWVNTCSWPTSPWTSHTCPPPWLMTRYWPKSGMFPPISVCLSLITMCWIVHMFLHFLLFSFIWMSFFR